MDSGKLAPVTAKAHTRTQMALHIRAIGMTVSRMELVQSHGSMALCMKVPMSKASKAVMDVSNGKMEAFMRAISLKTRCRAMVHTSGLTVASSQANGTTT